MKVLLVGAGGYASGYVKLLLSKKIPNLEFEGIVDPYIDFAKEKEAIIKAEIPIYSAMDEFYREHNADLAVVCTPTYLHRECSINALSHGSYVLCEKPVAPTLSEANAMLSAEAEYGKWIAIGYQWSFSDAVQELKRDIIDGKLGAPVSLKTAISWPRDKAYYGRGTGWAGRISKDGVMILDSIASNACAHYIHNMLFVLGDEMSLSTNISSFNAECYRANDIENFDTCSILMKTEKGVPLYFIASHATDKKRDPEFVYSFEKATVTYSKDDGPFIKAVFDDKREKIYGDPFEDNFKKLSDSILAIEKGSVPICTVRTAIPHASLIEDIYRKAEIKEFPRERVVISEERNAVTVRGLFDDMYKAYSKTAMLSEI